MVPAAVVLEDFHGRKDQAVPEPQFGLRNVAVGARGRFAHDRTQPIRFNDAQERFGVADGAAIGQENHVGGEPRFQRRHLPTRPLPLDAGLIGTMPFGYVPLGGFERRCREMAQPRRRQGRIAAQVENQTARLRQTGHAGLPFRHRHAGPGPS
jgi:hypothetical protein